MTISNICRVSNKDSYLKLGEDGWVFKHNGFEVRILHDILSIDAILEVIEWLGEVDKEYGDPAKAYGLLFNVFNEWKPKLDDVRKLFPNIVGEDNNVKLAILSLLSLKLREKEERVMGVIVRGANSSGKSYFSRSILKPFQEFVDEFTSMTPAFMQREFSNKDVNGRIIYIQEIGGKDGGIPYQLHISMSEGRATIGVCEFIGGKWRGQKITVKGYPFLWATTTNLVLSQDIQDRTIEIYMDESEEQTKKICRFYAELDSDYFYKEAFKMFSEGCFKMFKRFVWDHIPDGCIVNIPFIRGVEREFEKHELSVKFRRDYKKITALIKAHAILNWRDRVKVDLDSGKIIEKGEPRDVDRFFEEYGKNGVKPRLLIIAEWEDFYEVYKLVESSFKPTLTSLDEKDRRILQALRELENEPEPPTYAVLHKKTGIPTPTIRIWKIPKLERLGYVIVDRDVKPHRITLLKEAIEYKIDLEGLREEIEGEVLKYIEEIKSLYTDSQIGENKNPSSSKLEERVKRVIQPKTQNPSFSRLEKRGESFSAEASLVGEIEGNRKAYKDESNGGNNTLESSLEMNVKGVGRVCGSCIYYIGLKCSKNPSWITISPYSSYAEKCSYYNARPP